jgi:CheY-like chemotaxis protein
MEKRDYLLCIDDDADDCQLLHEAFLKWRPDIKLRFESSGEDALRFLNRQDIQHHPPALIILDMNMPGMNGLETLVEIRKVLKKFTPIIFLTTTPRDNAIQFGDKNGAALFKKPTNLAEYEDLVTSLVNTFIDL